VRYLVVALALGLVIGPAEPVSAQQVRSGVLTHRPSHPRPRVPYRQGSGRAAPLATTTFGNRVLYFAVAQQMPHIAEGPTSGTTRLHGKTGISPLAA
jgi:hypothetical protein